jgi:error-prone DNA polymerase
MVHLTDMDAWERMVADYGLLGLSPSYHPLGLLRERLPRDILTNAQLRAAADGRRVRTAGLVVCRQRPGTAKGFVFLLLEDETGLTNVVVRPDLYEAQRVVIRAEPYVCVEGTVQLRSGTLNLLATGIARLAEVPDLLLPRPPLQHPHPGRPRGARVPDDPGEQATSEGAAARSAPGPELEPLRLATPASHDFH